MADPEGNEICVQDSVAYEVIVLKPSVAEVMRRIAIRGRAGDLQRLVERKQDVEHQMQVLESGTLRSYRAIDIRPFRSRKSPRLASSHLAGSLPDAANSCAPVAV